MPAPDEEIEELNRVLFGPLKDHDRERQGCMNEYPIARRANNFMVQAEAAPALHLDQLMQTAEILAKAGYFGMDQAPQVFAKLLYGQELGLSPMASLQLIHVMEVNGRKSLAPHYSVQAGRIKAHPRYDYRIVSEQYTGEKGTPTNLGDHCTLAAIVDGEEVGQVTYSSWMHFMSANQNKVYQTHPQNMYFAAALRLLINKYFPDILRGAVAPDEPFITIESPTEEIAIEHTPIRERLAAEQAVKEWVMGQAKLYNMEPLEALSTMTEAGIDTTALDPDQLNDYAIQLHNHFNS